jgi:hypothetical protein
MKKPVKKETTVSLLAKDVHNKLKPTIKFISKLDRKSRFYTVGLVLATVLLLLTSTYAGLRASDAYSTDSNAIITTQQFGKDIKLPVTLPGPHATLIILPIVYLQGQLPYHYTSFTLVNIGLVVITMLAWAFLLIKLFGRKYEVLILVLLSSLVFTSIIFSLSLAYTTIRNIEYPIILWFVLIVSDLLKRRRYSRKQLILAATGSILFSITLAGDSFFNYAILLPLLFVIAWYWAQSRQFTANMIKAVGLIVAVIIGAALLKLILSKTGLIYFNYAFWGQNSIVPTSSLAPSLTIALRQLMDLQGGNIFGQVIHHHNLAIFVNFGLLILSIVSLILIIIKTNRNYRMKKGLTDDNNFVFVTMAISYFVVFLIYVLSGYVISVLPNGQIISVENTRYISLLPLISTIGLVWLIKNYYKESKVLLVMICALLLVCIPASYHRVDAAYKSGVQLELAPSRDSINQILYALQSNDVHEVVSDYWYGPVLRFWSNDSINLAQTSGCSLPLTATVEKEGQFTRREGVKSAVIIDRGGLNYAYWACTNEQVEQIYGTPSKKLEAPGVTSTPVEIWIYNAE